MVLLLDTADNNGTHRRLLDKVQTTIPAASLEVYDSFDDLYAKLKKPREDTAITILRAADQNQLNGFKRLLELLNDIQIVLILPDHENETIALSHHLHPRFLTYADSSFDDLAAVVANMLQKSLHSR